MDHQSIEEEWRVELLDWMSLLEYRQSLGWSGYHILDTKIRVKVSDMPQRRERYDRKFGISAIEVVLSDEKHMKKLSGELGVKDSTLRRWDNGIKLNLTV